jgi:CRISPR type I-E-associated protein CasA/Cse1
MSEPRSYNLLCKPWIPVVWRSDAAGEKPDKVGIRRALEDAHEIRCISHTAPFIEFGLYRLLITIVLDAYIVAGQRPTIGKMKAMLAGEQFDRSILDEYEYLSGHREGLDLWAGESPFLQRKAATGKDERKAVIGMFPAIPSGVNVTHWHHYREDEARLSEDVAAQFLTTVSPFNFKTKPGEARTLAGDPPLYALVLGETLFETIVLNLPRPNGRMTAQKERDNGPVWRTQLDLANLPRSPTTTQGFTWPVRVVELQNDGAHVMKAVNRSAYKDRKKAEREKKGNLFAWRDPNAGTESGAVLVNHVRTRLGVPVWRDAVPLFLISGEGDLLRGERPMNSAKAVVRRSRPEVITNALRVLDAPQFRAAVYGMRKKSGAGDVKVEEWFRSVLAFPTEVARDSRLSARAIDAFKKTQHAADVLQRALRMLRPPVKASKGKRQRLGRGETDALADFWQCLEPVLSRTYLDDLGRGDSRAEAGLYGTIRKEARDALARAAAPHRRTADGLFRSANAGNWFEGRLRRLLPRPPQERSS